MKFDNEPRKILESNKIFRVILLLLDDFIRALKIFIIITETKICYTCQSNGSSEQILSSETHHKQSSCSLSCQYQLTYLLTYSMEQGPSWEAS